MGYNRFNRMEVRYERKDSGTGAADRRPSHRLYFQEDDQRKDTLLSSVDRKWEEAQPISAGWRTGAAAGAGAAPATSNFIINEPVETLSPDFTKISFTTPANGAGTSIEAL